MVDQEPNKTKALYDAVSKDYDLGSFEDFNKKLQDPTKRKAFYDGVGKEYQLGTYSDFETKVGAGKKYTHPNYFQRLWKWLKSFAG